MNVETDIASIAMSPKRMIYDTSDYVCQDFQNRQYCFYR